MLPSLYVAARLFAERVALYKGADVGPDACQVATDVLDRLIQSYARQLPANEQGGFLRAAGYQMSHELTKNFRMV
jgi:hypothetical protein